MERGKRMSAVCRGPAHEKKPPREGSTPPLERLDGMRRLALLLTLPLLLAAADDDSARYPLDDIARVLGAGERMPCEEGKLELTLYRGEHLRYHKPLRVSPAFVPKLEAFERIVEEVALEHYGRAPSRIVHLGSYNCRRMRRYPDWISEHSLGNALDVSGFDFGPIPRGAQLAEGLPRSLSRAFSVRIDKHFRAQGASAHHARFLHELARRLISRPDVFSVVLGPAWPGHENHLHLDHAPYRVVEVFDEP